ncbi:hypothetical protein AC579_10469 [Pseudocercospora musae]|uniref:Uncharacterized protein n=1 Tax=Pseudocercospora musae TaxID=113226 RepID=A0A139IDQ4_9PEZI|nr:hypothetical protein AC579_10469 [Pseudocercospora musae]
MEMRPDWHCGVDGGGVDGGERGRRTLSENGGVCATREAVLDDGLHDARFGQLQALGGQDYPNYRHVCPFSGQAKQNVACSHCGRGVCDGDDGDDYVGWATQT